MQEWNLQSGARKSDLSERPFQDGDRVRTVLGLDPEGNLVRRDVLADEEADLEGDRAVAQWIRTFRSDTTERELEKEAVQSTEDIFFQMVEAAESEDSGEAAENSGDALEERNALLFLLALYLERKRVIRPLGLPEKQGLQRYRHPGRDREVAVRTSRLDPELLQRLSRQLDQLFGR